MSRTAFKKFTSMFCMYAAGFCSAVALWHLTVNSIPMTIFLLILSGLNFAVGIYNGR